MQVDLHDGRKWFLSTSSEYDFSKPPEVVRTPPANSEKNLTLTLKLTASSIPKRSV